MLRLLQSDAPPRNALAAEPRIASMLSLYQMCQSMRSLPDAGGLLDMRADHYAYFQAFSGAESEYENSL